MKKLLSAAIALVMGLSMSAPVLAVDGVGGNEHPYSDETTIKIDKEIKLTNEGTANPAETFNFTVGGGKVESGNATSAPAFPSGTFSIPIAQGGLLGTVNIILPTFEHVGEYLYEVKEVAGDTAGFVYDGETYYLKITVINDEENGGFKRVLTLYDGKDVKVDAFENEFNAGSLVINKEITGNNAVYTDEFDVTVTLTPDEGKNIKEGPINVSGTNFTPGKVTKVGNNVIVTFTVTNGSEVSINNIPYDVTYAVTEDSRAYTSNEPDNGFTGDINAATQTVDIENNLDTEINTGVNLDNLPYILVLALVGVGLISFTVRKRVRN